MALNFFVFFRFRGSSSKLLLQLLDLFLSKDVVELDTRLLVNVLRGSIKLCFFIKLIPLFL
jgi:hypothetical protein